MGCPSSGTVKEVKAILWQTLKLAQKTLKSLAKDDPDRIFRGCHCISQIGGQLVRTIEIAELEQRMQELETEVKDIRNASSRATV